MALITEQQHFVLVPFMAQGHMIPMIDIARLLAHRGVRITLFLTPHNATRVKAVIDRAQQSGLPIQVVQLGYFPCAEVGLPEGCENVDLLPSFDMGMNFYAATKLLQPRIEEVMREMKPTPTCIISDMCLPWTTNIARNLNIPKIVFHGMCSFSLLCMHNIWNWDGFESLESESQYFEVPGLPNKNKIEITKAQLAQLVKPSSEERSKYAKEKKDAEDSAFGIVVNSFEELEPEYIKEFKKGRNVWAIGPVSLCNKEESDMAERGNMPSIDKHHCLKWLDSMEANSVLFVCLGSLSRLPTPQMIELGLALESSNRPFIWVIRHISDEFQNWLRQEKYEERVKEQQGLIIYGWAPQVLILSHPSIGGFLTHCGWNSSLEAITSGLPLITWPLFGEQFLNERLIVNVLRIGVKTGVEFPVLFGAEEQTGVQVNRDDIVVAIEEVMGGGEEAEMRRKRMKKLGEMARTAMEGGGSSFHNIAKLIQDVAEESNARTSV
ncbi:PREDICTED: UDP-glycosyltransferase 73C1-like [Ipomoea nil]|uniref:UDP-glycosyltransferase 73C1-like n=1 Tax=Ipomoea nil TaxID=35883 RepID=UPI000901837B|nr:PREDICTED: UDP-glycosyltransferase 73C1-like [Ipomoea nil]XP_019167963.1 PREDICTED: UDP-glycosyltransferase 73C1-like [Ipomoea nil]